jgi:hypothetical protein
MKSKRNIIDLAKIDKDTYQENHSGIKWTRSISNSSHLQDFNIEVDLARGLKLWHDNDNSKITCSAFFPFDKAIIGIYSKYDKEINNCHFLGARKVDIPNLGYSERPGCALTIQSENDNTGPRIVIIPHISNTETSAALEVIVYASKQIVDKLIATINTSSDYVSLTIKTPINNFDRKLVDFINLDEQQHSNTTISFSAESNKHALLTRPRLFKEAITIVMRKSLLSFLSNAYLLFWIGLIVWIIINYSSSNS